VSQDQCSELLAELGLDGDDPQDTAGGTAFAMPSCAIQILQIASRINHPLPICASFCPFQIFPACWQKEEFNQALAMLAICKSWL